jgi:hypothetical protein
MTQPYPSQTQQYCLIQAEVLMDGLERGTVELEGIIAKPQIVDALAGSEELLTRFSRWLEALPDSVRGEAINALVSKDWARQDTELLPTTCLAHPTLARHPADMTSSSALKLLTYLTNRETPHAQHADKLKSQGHALALISLQALARDGDKTPYWWVPQAGMLLEKDPALSEQFSQLEFSTLEKIRTAAETLVADMENGGTLDKKAMQGHVMSLQRVTHRAMLSLEARMTTDKNNIRRTANDRTPL